MSTLTELRIAAALATGHPTLVVPTATPEDTLRSLEAHLGELPQAEWAGDCELWVDLPGLTAEHWLTLVPHLPEDALLLPGESSGRRAARDLGLLVEEVIELDEVEFVHRVHVEDGLSIWPHLLPGLPDPAVLELEAELGEAVGRSFVSDRGSGTVQPVLCPETGRFGVVLSWTDAAVLDGVAPGVAAVIRRRASHPELRLAPSVEVDRRMGLSLLCWAVAASRPTLPADLPQLPPSDVNLDELVSRMGRGIRGLEIQVMPAESHLLAALAGAAFMEAHLPSASPGVPRWVAGAFCPTWQVEVEAGLVLGGLESLADEPSVAAIRVLPSDPDGLTLPMEVFDLGGLVCRGGWAVRLRNGLTGRDLLPGVEPRAATPEDDVVEAQLLEALAEAPGASWIPGERLARTVEDPLGRAGIELHLDGRDALDAHALCGALSALLAVAPPEYEPMVWYGRRGHEVVVQWWRVHHELPMSTDG